METFWTVYHLLSTNQFIKHHKLSRDMFPLSGLTGIEFTFYTATLPTCAVSNLPLLYPYRFLFIGNFDILTYGGFSSLT